MANRTGTSVCTVCAHNRRPEIDLALARGVSPLALSRRFQVGQDNLYRHRTRHLSAVLRAKLLCDPEIEGMDLPALVDRESSSLLLNLVNLGHCLYASRDTAEQCGDHAMVVRVIAQLHRNLELRGEVVGQLGGSSVTVNNTATILMSPGYLELRATIIKALVGFPEASHSVAEALCRLETQVAEDITRSGNGKARG